MYQSYPGSDRSPEQPGQSASSVPPPVATAVKVMYAGAVASLIGIGIDMTTLGSLRSRLTTSNPSWTPAQVTNGVHLEIGVFIASGLIGAALWIWMAQSCRAGKGWARIVSTVLFAIETIAALVSLGASAGGLTGGGATRIYGILVWLIGLAALILLWRRASSDYFKSVPRY